VGPRKHALDWAQVTVGRVIIREKDMLGHADDTAVSCAKMTEPIDLVCGLEGSTSSIVLAR